MVTLMAALLTILCSVVDAGLMGRREEQHAQSPGKATLPGQLCFLVAQVLLSGGGSLWALSTCTLFLFAAGMAAFSMLALLLNRTLILWANGAAQETAALAMLALNPPPDNMSIHCVDRLPFDPPLGTCWMRLHSG